MLKKFAIGLLAFFSASSLYSQEVIFSIDCSRAAYAKILRVHGSKTEKIDSLFLKNSKYVFIPDSSTVSGEYLFALPGKPEIHFLYTGAGFSVHAADSTLEQTITYLGSKENELFLKFRGNKEEFKLKKERLERLIQQASKNAKQQQVYASDLRSAEREYSESALTLANENPGTLLSTIIKASIIPIPPDSLSDDKQKIWKQQHFFDNANLTDPRLEYTEASDNLIWNYLELFFKTNLDKESQESIFKSALNNLFGRSDVAENLILFWANDLFNTFAETDYDGLTTYLWDNFIQSHCSQNDGQSTSPADIERIKATAVGQKAYDFTVETNKGNFTLSTAGSNYTLVLFWASWCPHCIHELPIIEKIYNRYKSKGFGIIGLSVDYDKSEYTNFLKKYKVDWPNVLAAQSWQNEICKRYNVTGTPKMVLVDRNLTIISKPTTPEQLEAKLMEIFEH